MPMSADEAMEIIRDYVYNCGYDHLGLPLVNELPPRAVEAIREAFAIAATVRNPGDAIRAFVEQHPRRADLPWYVRGLARQFCEFVLERAGVEVPREKAQEEGDT